MAGFTRRFISCHVMAGSTWRFISYHVMVGCNHKVISCHDVVRSGLLTVYDGYMVWYACPALGQGRRGTCPRPPPAQGPYMISTLYN